MKKDDLKNIIQERLDKKFPDFKSGWDLFVKEVGYEFVNLLKDRFQEELKMFKEISQFKISIVVDNNFVFGQIKSIAEKGTKLEDSFIYKIAKLKSVKIYAPPKLKEELYDKIEHVLNVNNSIAIEHASKILEMIEIKDAFWVDEWKKANNLIGHTDSDDVPYLALAINLGSHSIVSYDKVFHTAGITQVWKMPDIDKVITNYHKGFISFYILGSTAFITQFIWKILIAIFKIIGEILIGLLQPLLLIASGTITVLSGVPIEVWFIIIGIWLVSEDFQSVSKDMAIKIGEVANTCLKYINEFISWLIDFIKQIYEVFKPTGVTMLEFAAYFVAEYQELQLQVSDLNKKRTK